MAFIDVINKNGKKDKKPPTVYKSWLDFWEKKQDKRASNCEVMSCRGNAELGGHVIKVIDENKEYILPLCLSCNNKEHSYMAREGDLVEVNSS
jgi:hypothetical protein